MSQGNNTPKISPRVKRIARIIAASLAGVGIATVISTICIYDSFFNRYERPDYDLYPGMYCYERFSGGLEREILKIQSGDNQLQAYYYPAEDSRGLAVLAHGFHAGADDYLPLIEAVVKGGYSVLTYDVTGVYSSEGDSVVGMCQSLYDLDNVLNFARDDMRFGPMPKFVIGHSWGGYAAASVLALHSEVRGAALIAPMNSGADVMLEKAQQYAGDAVLASKPIFDVYHRILFGDYMEYNAVVGINSTNAYILIAQGVDDTVITPDGQSITAHLDELTNPNVSLYWGSGMNGSHTGIWHSVEAELYKQSIENQIKDLEKKLDRSLTDEELCDFYATVDHRLYSDVNAELVNLIITTFDKGLEL